ncbi:GGDEF domain-containing protein [Proteobacteria bacterium 005FR1]|nr:GGDEF domain-containing protein [Proteobacteria bacterium 005FR1]
MIELNANYREAMAHQIYSAIGFLVVPFSILALWRGQLLLAIPPLATALLCAINVIYFRKSQRLPVERLFISVLYIVDVVIVIHELGTVGAFWAFPTLLALYWVHARRTAVYLVGIFYVSVCAAGYFALDPETSLRFAVTLLMTATFFNIASGMFEKQYEDLERLTVTDHLTGAFNRRFMDSKIDELIERNKRNGGTASLIALDIDHFKRINDDHGHSVGDRILVDLVILIRDRVRVLDSVCRSGGEEFLIILPDTSEQMAKALGEELRLSIGSSPLLKDSQVTVSCGVSGLIPGDDRDSWLHRCDQALYCAKRSGRNTVAVPAPAFFNDVVAKA